MLLQEFFCLLYILFCAFYVGHCRSPLCAAILRSPLRFYCSGIVELLCWLHPFLPLGVCEAADFQDRLASKGSIADQDVSAARLQLLLQGIALVLLDLAGIDGDGLTGWELR